MKRIQITISLLCFLIATSVVFAQPEQKPRIDAEKQKKEAATGTQAIGFVDKNDDGVNDRFYDANGDGKNDVDGKEYRHKFEFKDKNKDKINDLWVDRDGDGVNDLAPKFKGKERRDVHRNVLDVNGDGRNDITGEVFDKKKPRWQGEKWGFWDEWKGKLRGRFIDTDGDGIDDRMKGFDDVIGHGKHRGRMQDVFIDEDGDGISDDRSDFINRMGKCGRGRHEGQSRGGGGHRH